MWTLKNKKSASGRNDIQFFFLIATASALSLTIAYFTYRQLGFGKGVSSAKNKDDEDEVELDTLHLFDKDDTTDSTSASASTDKSKADESPKQSQRVQEQPSRSQTPVMSNTSNSDALQKDVGEDSNVSDKGASLSYSDLEALDKEGKKYFKAQMYLQAAECFTKALDVGEKLRKEKSDSNIVTKQEKTLLNNRSAMYEKQANASTDRDERNTWIELSLADVDTLLSYEVSHMKGRQRKLRLLEAAKPPKYFEALVEACAMQLLFLQEHKDRLRMGLQLPPGVKPPVDQDKIDSVLTELLPTELDKFLLMKQKHKEAGIENNIPSVMTVVGLLKSFRGYNSWMAMAAKDMNTKLLSIELRNIGKESSLEKMSLLLRRGRRHAFEQDFESAVADFDEGMKVVDDIQISGSEDDRRQLEIDENYPRLLEWAGLGRHLRYDLDGAATLYDKCIELEPLNTELLVKRAGAAMDNAQLDKALELFQTALALEPEATDALLHRANLYMMQGKTKDAKEELNRCIELKPDFITAYLRLATVNMMESDMSGAMKALDNAEKLEPNSSDVQSYRGELYFAQGNVEEAKASFDAAIKLDPNNPNAYLNSGLLVMQTPTASGMPDVFESIRLMNKAIDIDPQALNAYAHLGQLKLTMCKNLADAREVVALYDKGMKQCRTKEEAKEICSMRILAVAQIHAAEALKMDTLG